MTEIIKTPLTVLHIIACLFLMLVVLVQPGKSGGLGAFTGAAAQQVFGGRGAGNFLTKTTWITATVFFVSSLSLAYLSSSSDESLEKKAQAATKVEKPVPVTPGPSAAPPSPAAPAPAAPAPAPEAPAEPSPAPPPEPEAPRPAAPKPAAPKPAAPRPVAPKPAAPPADEPAPVESPAPAPAPAPGE